MSLAPRALPTMGTSFQNSVGRAVGSGVGVAEGVPDGVGDSEGIGVRVGVGEGFRVDVGAGVAVRVVVGVGVGVEVGGREGVAEAVFTTVAPDSARRPQPTRTGAIKASTNTQSQVMPFLLLWFGCLWAIDCLPNRTMQDLTQ